MAIDTTIHSASAPGGLRDGDVLLLRVPGRLPNPVIERVQRRLLRDLGGVPESTVLSAARFTHAALVYEGLPVWEWNWRVAEMTWPRCRTRPLVELPSGTLCLARRPQRLRQDPSSVGGVLSEDADEGLCSEAVGYAIRDALKRRAYPALELLSYWCWSWPCKLGGRKFREVFRSESRDVCSGSVWRWLREAGLYPEADGTCDASPEAWYPARLACDQERFRTVAAWRVP